MRNFYAYVFHPNKRFTVVFVSFFSYKKELKELKELTGSNKIENNILRKINKGTLKPEINSPCFGNSRILCCNQVTTTLTFNSQQT